MDKKSTLDITQKVYSGLLTYGDLFGVISDYCIEKGKKGALSYQFTILLIERGMAREPFSIALEYFQKKFSICTLTDAKGKVITIF